MKSFKHSRMCNLVLVLLVGLCSTSPVLGENISGNEEKECTLPDRSLGVCKPSFECPRSGTSVTECSTQGGIVYVCCETTKTGSFSHIGTDRTTEPPRKLNETSKTENGTNGDKIAERFFFFDDPISVNWQNKDDRRSVQHNYNSYFGEKGRNTFRDVDVDSLEIVPVNLYNLGGNNKQENVQYQSETDRRRTEQPYYSGYESYEKQGRKKYSWESNQRTTSRPSNSAHYYFEEEDQRYQWNSNRRTTERPYNPEYNYYDQQKDQKYPWNPNRRTTERPYDPGFESNEKKGSEKYPWETSRQTTLRPSNPAHYYFEEEDQRYQWNSNRRTTERPYNPEYNYYDQQKDQKYPWNPNRRTTERPYDLGFESNEKKESGKYPWETSRQTTLRPSNPALTYYEPQEDQQYPRGTNRRTTERPYNPEYNYYDQQKDQKYPWNPNRRTTERPYDLGFESNEKKESGKYPWETSRQTTLRPSNPALTYYEPQEDQQYPWYTNRWTTERPRGTRMTTESSRKKQTPVPEGFVFFSDNEKRKRISKIKCDEYSEIVTQTISGLPLVPDPSPIKIKVDECKNFQSLIVGGKNTSLGEYPHMAAIGFFDRPSRQMKWKCGGSLISEQYVLTAAHCAISKFGKPVRVRLGDYNLNRDDDGAHPEDHTIAEIIIHPDYISSKKYNDIALLRLSERVNIKKDIRPACLYTEFNIRHSTATAIGWGRLHRTENQSDILQKVSLDIIDNKSCQKPYNNSNNIQIANTLPRGIIRSQLCAGDLTGKRDTCQGDSGGPLEILSDSNLCVHYVIGITSFGISCASPNSPGVYTRVSSYIPWIERIVWPGQ